MPLLPFASAGGISQTNADARYLKKTGDTGNGSYTLNATDATNPLLTLANFYNTVLLKDRFNRTGSSLGTADVGGTWVVAGGGTFNIFGNFAHYVTGGTDSQATLDAGTADVTAQVSCITNQDDGLVFRFSDTNNFWVAILASNIVYLYKRVAGTYSLVNSASVSTALGRSSLTICASGDNISVFFNFVSLFSTTDSFNNTATKCGLRSTTSDTLWDNFLVTNFISLSNVGGDFLQWQDPAGNLLGRITPYGELNVLNTLATNLGLVGIGTGSPTFPLDIHAPDSGGSETVIAAQAAVGSFNVEFRNTSSTNNKTQFVLGGGSPGGTYGRTYSIGIDPGATGAVNFYLSDNANNFIPLFIDPNDNVGVSNAANTAFGGGTLGASFTAQPKAAGTIAEIIQGFTSQSADLTQWQKSDSTVYTSIGSTGLVNKYNSVATVGWGVPAIYGRGRSTAQTAAVASVATYTVGAADGSFFVSANILVTTATLHSFTCSDIY